MNLMQQSALGDRYTLVEPLGDGGMAKVFLASDNSLGREVALKVLREQYADDEEFVERFRREAISAATLNHPGIVQVYDRGRAADGSFYIAMEYVPGGTLKEHIRAKGALAPREAAEIASRVADALALAHEHGIVHRDIKPQNVLLTASGEAKVSDFGIARAASTKTMTQTNSVLGTLAYMSPEQVRGERVGPASDLYSLGVVLYEMLTGELPYRGEDPIATAMKHLEEPPRNPREVNPAVSQELGALVVKLLAKDPQDRYASAASLSEDLRRVRDGSQPVVASPGDETIGQVSSGTGATRPAPAAAASGPATSFGRRRTLVVSLAASLLVVALLVGLAWAMGRDTSNQKPPDAGVAKRVEVPGVVGLSQDEAQKRLTEQGLELGGLDEAQSETVAEGAVIEQAPDAGSRIDQGRAVNLVLSTGPPQDPVPQTSPSATATASPATASPAATKKAGKEEQKRRKEAREQAAERREEARERAQDRREEQQEKGEQ